MIIDRLFDQVEKKGPICLGLDTDLAYLPEDFYPELRLKDRIFKFNQEIIDHTSDMVAIYKVQIAFYEQYGISGLEAYRDTLAYLRRKSSLTIGDVKRGDIANTGDAYARAHFSGDFEADFITVNPYMGYDTLEPYLDYINSGQKGIFVLLRTSNPGAKDIESQMVASKSIYQMVGDTLSQMGKDYMGSSGYSSIGAVVGATSPEELKTLRKDYPSMFFLIPGYGAQGGQAKDVALGLEDGNGSVINSSRGLITSHLESGSTDIGRYAKIAVEKMREDLEIERFL